MIGHKIRGFTVFCDEVRQESNGKNIYIGVYNNVIIFPANDPPPIPSLTLLVNLWIDPDVSLNEDLDLRVTVPWADEPAIQMKFDVKKAILDGKKTGMLEDGQILSIQIPLVFNNLKFEKEGLISVRAYASREEFKLGSLMIKFMDPQPKNQT